MNEELKSQIERSQELYQELKAECESRMQESSVHPRSLNLAVEVLSKLRSILDHTAYIVFENKIKPNLNAAEAEKVKIYFPIADDEQSFRSQLGRAKFLELELYSPRTFAILRGVQPFTSSGNQWLATLRDLSNVGKHVRLIRQDRRVTKRTTVTGPGGAVSWGEGVVFGSGVSVMGATIDPKTQNIVSTPGVQSRTERIISFEFPDAGVNALGFLNEAIAKVQYTVTQVLENL
jgi:hypothetical protein